MKMIKFAYTIKLNQKIKLFFILNNYKIAHYKKL